MRGVNPSERYETEDTLDGKIERTLEAIHEHISNAWTTPASCPVTERGDCEERGKHDWPEQSLEYHLAAAESATCRLFQYLAVAKREEPKAAQGEPTSGTWHAAPSMEGEPFWCVLNERGNILAMRVTTQANAQFIARACNAHDDLVAACEAALRDFTEYDCFVETNAVLEQLRAALNKAKGGNP